MQAKRIELGRDEVLVHKGLEIDRDVLDAVVDTNKRLLWAFVRGRNGDIRAVPYSESHVIWLTEDDIIKPEEVEI
jgi:hypothetical protein